MKKIFFSIFLAAGGLLTQSAKAQVGVSVGMQIGPLVINVHKPIMAPAPVVYDDYYYLPDVEAYYSVPEHCYYYMDDDDRWISGQYLPGRYHDYNWQSARRYEVRAQRPYANHDFYRNKFGGNRGGGWGGNGDQYADRGGYNRRGGNDVYRQPQRNDERYDNRGGYGGRLPSSPYDSNNAGGGRGGYERQMPQNRNNGGWNNDRQQDNNGWNNRRNDNNNGWNGNRQNDNEGNNGRNRNYGPDRSQGGIFNNGGDNRSNDGVQSNRGNRPQGEYSRPSNNNEGQGQNNNPNGGGDRGNRGGDGQQRGGNYGGGRQQMASVPRMGF